MVVSINVLRSLRTARRRAAFYAASEVEIASAFAMDPVLAPYRQAGPAKASERSGSVTALPVQPSTTGPELRPVS
jgi:hypothetical protein